MRKSDQKSATATTGKSKKKRGSIFSIFSWKKKTKTEPLAEPLPPSSSNLLTVNNHPRFDDLNSVVDDSSHILISTPPIMSRKKYPAPPPPDETNKENFFAQRRKSSLNSSRTSKKGLRNSSRRSSIKNNKLKPKSSGVKAEPNAKHVKAQEETTITKKAANAETHNVPQSSGKIEPKSENLSGAENNPKVNNNSSEMASPSASSSRLHVDAKNQDKAIEAPAPELPQTLPPDKASVVTKYSFKALSKPLIESKTIDQFLIKQTELEFLELSVSVKPPNVILTPSPPANLPIVKSASATSSPITAKKKSKPDSPVSLTQTKVASPKSASRARLTPPPKAAEKESPVTHRKYSSPRLSKKPSPDSTAKESPTSSEMQSADLKYRLQNEHQKLLQLFDEWEMLRKPHYHSYNRYDKATSNGQSYSADLIMSKQEELLKQHSTVSALYQQLLAPITTNSASNTLPRLKQLPTRHIINSENNSPVVKHASPFLFKSQSTMDIHNDNNNVRSEPERNYFTGTYSPRPNAKRHSLGDALHNNRPRLGDKTIVTENGSHPDQKTRKYLIENNHSTPAYVSPVIRNIPITSSKITDNGKSQVIQNGSHTPTNGNSHFEYKPSTWQPTKGINTHKEYNIPIKTAQSNAPNANGTQYQPHKPNAETVDTKKVTPIRDEPKTAKPASPLVARQEIKYEFKKDPLPKTSYSTLNNNTNKPQTPVPAIHGPGANFAAVTLKKVPKPVEKSFNLGRVLNDNEARQKEQQSQQPTNGVYDENRATAVPPQAPPPPPPNNFNNPPPPPPATLRTARPIKDMDAVRGDMLSQIRQAGGVQFLRSKN